MRVEKTFSVSLEISMIFFIMRKRLVDCGVLMIPLYPLIRWLKLVISKNWLAMVVVLLGEV